MILIAKGYLKIEAIVSCCQVMVTAGADGRLTLVLHVLLSCLAVQH